MAVRTQGSHWINRVVTNQTDARVDWFDNPVMDHKSVTNAGANGDHRKVIRISCDTEPMFRPGEGEQVIVDNSGQSSCGFDECAQVNVG